MVGVINSCAERSTISYMTQQDLLDGSAMRGKIPILVQESAGSRDLVVVRTVNFPRGAMLSSPPDTRASLILRLPNAADVAAWDEFVAVYEPLVFRLALGRGLQPADADDLVQEVFSAVANQVGEWLQRMDRGSFRAWLLRIARNIA